MRVNKASLLKIIIFSILLLEYCTDPKLKTKGIPLDSSYIIYKKEIHPIDSVPEGFDVLIKSKNSENVEFVFRDKMESSWNIGDTVWVGFDGQSQYVYRKNVIMQY